MDEIRIIHTGDTHLGYRQYHSDVRRKDFLNAFSRVVDNAIEMHVDAVVHAGDLFDSRNPTLDDILDAMGLFSRLKYAGIPLLAIVGNHESKQSTQWLDLYSSLGLVTRLGAKPFRLGDVAVYGIDSVPRTKIPLFDYSVFGDKKTDSKYNLLVMHQLVKPFSFGDWDIAEVIASVPFDIHAVLLGDNHRREITKIGNTWVTYAGSTERNSTSEREPRSYNIITAGEEGVEISRRIIPTRDFVFIPVELSEGGDVLEDIFSAVKEYDIAEKVAFVELSGDVKARLDFSEVEKFLLARGALVSGIRDLRSGIDTITDPSMKVSFSDPDDVVKEEIRKMNLTSGGLLLDDIIRDPLIVKTRVGDEAELKLGEMLEKIDFSEPVSVNRPIHTEYQGEDESGTAEGIPDVNTGASASDSLSASNEVQNNVVSETKDSYSPEIPEDSGSAILPANESNADGHGSGSENNSPGHRNKPADKDKKESAAVKPRQYNLGDYL